MTVVPVLHQLFCGGQVSSDVKKGWMLGIKILHGAYHGGAASSVVQCYRAADCAQLS